MAGKPAPRDLLIEPSRLIDAYERDLPDPAIPEHRVSFGTSGHRGTSLLRSFNEAHILAIVQAVCEYRKTAGITGPLFLGKDTHALSAPAHRTTLEVLAAHDVTVMVQKGQGSAAEFGYTPTPAISHAILTFNRNRPNKDSGQADGLIITPSHNPPQDGGIKYNPPHGGPADAKVTLWIEKRANAIIENKLHEVRRLPYNQALQKSTTVLHDFIQPYVEDLSNIIDMEAIARSGLRLGVDPLGGAAIHYWEPIRERYNLTLDLVNCNVDPTFSFMRVDRDGKIRMDCSSPYAMAGLIDLKDRYDIAFGNDPDTDRHGIVTPSCGLMNPNHYLSVAISYLCQVRTGWSPKAAIGKTLVSSSMIDRVVQSLGRNLSEVPVGFKWFVDGLLDGSCAFGGEESAGASFVRKDGTVWTTDKDGILLNLLAAEITATTGRDPGLHYRNLEARFGAPVYERIDAPASPAQKKVLSGMSPETVKATMLAGEPITAKLTRAPGNNASIGGLKVTTENGWFAARPSGTEDVYKIYAESFRGADHLKLILEEAQTIVSASL